MFDEGIMFGYSVSVFWYRYRGVEYILGGGRVGGLGHRRRLYKRWGKYMCSALAGTVLVVPGRAPPPLPVEFLRDGREERRGDHHLRGSERTSLPRTRSTVTT